MTRHCEHVKANGHFCGSPALRGRNYCFFHIVNIGRRLRLQRYFDHGLQPPAIKLRDEEFDMPIQLTEEQYLKAKCAIFQYRLDHNLDAKDERAKVIPQRPAISQNILMGARKPVASVPEQEQQLEVSNSPVSRG